MTKGLSTTEETERILAKRGEDERQQTVATERQATGLTLRTLLEGVEVRSEAYAGEVKIRQVACDSRKVERGALFVAIEGVAADGNKFAKDAVERGAVAIASASSRPADWPSNVAWVQVKEPRKALAITAANFFGRPALALRLVGVTGTNGKTTTTSLIDSIVRASGAKTGLFGTIGYRTPRGEYPAPNTTPESVDLQSFFAEIRDGQGKYAVMEASSHALALDRLWGCHFAAAVFTNLTRDHIDFHKTFESYFAAKKHLFEGTGAGAPDVSVVNTDDEWGKKLAKLSKKTLTYGLTNGSDLIVKKFQLSFKGLDFTAQTPNGKIQAQSHLVGRINVYNILAAIGAGIGLGISNEVIEAGIRNLEAVAGTLSANRSGATVSGGGGLRAHRRCTGKLDSHRAGIKSQGADYYGVWLRWITRPDQAADYGRDLGTAERSFDFDQRQSAARRSVENYQRHCGGHAEVRW